MLHDVVEKSFDWSFDRLRAEGFSEGIVSVIDSPARRPGEDILEAVERARYMSLETIAPFSEDQAVMLSVVLTA